MLQTNYHRQDTREHPRCQYASPPWHLPHELPPWEQGTTLQRPGCFQKWGKVKWSCNNQIKNFLYSKLPFPHTNVLKYALISHNYNIGTFKTIFLQTFLNFITNCCPLLMEAFWLAFGLEHIYKPYRSREIPKFTVPTKPVGSVPSGTCGKPWSEGESISKIFSQIKTLQANHLINGDSVCRTASGFARVCS